MRTFSGLLLCLLLATSAVNAPLTQAQDEHQHISVDQLKRALAMADADAGADKEARERVREYLIKKWLDDRMIAEAEYKENLGRAIDSWYANNRDWRKISPEIWTKLRDADKGRIKLGIDPELTYAVPGPPKN